MGPRTPGCQTLGVDGDRDLARVALSLVEATVQGDPAADELLAEAFSDVREAARAHAYLAGFLLVLLAECRREPSQVTCARVRELLS